MMMAIRIFNGLESLPVTGDEAETAARLGFLEWVFGQPGEATPADARAALRELDGETPESDAGLAFVGYLRQATRPACFAPSRTGRARRLN